ncbi:MAG: hypothetical protein IPL08_17325 [Saprospiraceae bacterium]|nr:hypothetical protein [Saprospiraceae bacterium]
MDFMALFYQSEKGASMDITSSHQDEGLNDNVFLQVPSGRWESSALGLPPWRGGNPMPLQLI